MATRGQLNCGEIGNLGAMEQVHVLLFKLSLRIRIPSFRCGGASEGRVEGSRITQAIASMVKARDDDPSNLEVLLALGVSHTNDIVLNAKPSKYALDVQLFQL